MNRTQYTAEFKVEAVKQMVGKGHSVVDVAKGLRLERAFIPLDSTIPSSWITSF